MCYPSKKAVVQLFFSPLRESLSTFTSESLRKNVNQRRLFSKKYFCLRDVRASLITGFPHDTSEQQKTIPYPRTALWVGVHT